MSFNLKQFSVVAMILMLPLSINFAQAETALSEPQLESLLNTVQTASLQQAYQGEFIINRNAERLDVLRIANDYTEQRTRRHLQNMNQEPMDIVRDADEQIAIYPRRREIYDLPINNANFPGLFLLNSKHVAHHYTGVDTGTMDRVANTDCKRYVLDPSQRDRYGFVLCVEPKTGLLLKMTIRDTNRKQLEQFMFTSIHIGKHTQHSKIGPSYCYSGFKRADTKNEKKLSTDLSDAFEFPQGFQIVATSRVPLGTKRQATRLTLTDGLSSFSIFVRELEAEQDDSSNEAFTVADSVSVVSQRQGSYLITALGLMPRETLLKVIQTAKLTTINKTN